jgi:hypothetical protein
MTKNVQNSPRRYLWVIFLIFSLKVFLNALVHCTFIMVSKNVEQNKFQKHLLFLNQWLAFNRYPCWQTRRLLFRFKSRMSCFLYRILLTIPWCICLLKGPFQMLGHGIIFFVAYNRRVIHRWIVDIASMEQRVLKYTFYARNLQLWQNKLYYRLHCCSIFKMH